MLSSRNKIFIIALGVSYLLMVAYLSYRYPEQSNLFVQLTFGLILVGAAIAGLLLGNRIGRVKGILRVIKILIASYAISFASWLLLSTLMLPIVGYKGFMLVESHIFGYILLCVTLALLPIVSRKMS